MSGKTQKKIRQFYKREIKGQFKVIQSLIKDKPKFMPKWMWKKVVYRVLDLQGVEDSNKK